MNLLKTINQKLLTYTFRSDIGICGTCVLGDKWPGFFFFFLDCLKTIPSVCLLGTEHQRTHTETQTQINTGFVWVYVDLQDSSYGSSLLLV